MDGNIGTADLFLHVFFKMVRNIMSFFHRQVFTQGEMEVYKLLRSGPAGTQAMVAEKFAAVLFEDCGDFLADGFRQLFVKDVP